jgi:hypothetical protein
MEELKNFWLKKIWEDERGNLIPEDVDDDEELDIPDGDNHDDMLEDDDVVTITADSTAVDDWQHQQQHGHQSGLPYVQPWQMSYPPELVHSSAQYMDGMMLQGVVANSGAEGFEFSSVSYGNY